ncbi:MAG: CNNM domain-containing protein, partial [Butyricicoccus pullicaecorum]|nr:CNNM domain-containing protein [Butyricicoccus pullicaecorum]
MDTSDPGGNSILIQLVFLAFLTLVNAFFAGAEMAVVSVNKNRVEMLAEEGNKRARLLLTLFDDSTKFLSTIQVAITLAGFFSSASAATGISQVLGAKMTEFGIPYSNT